MAQRVSPGCTVTVAKPPPTPPPTPPSATLARPNDNARTAPARTADLRRRAGHGLRRRLARRLFRRDVGIAYICSTETVAERAFVCQVAPNKSLHRGR